MERAPRSRSWGAVYGAAAPVTLAMTVVEVFEPRVTESVVSEFGSLWDMAGTHAGDPARFGMLIVLVLAGLMVSMVVAPAANPARPWIIAVLCGAGAAMLWLRPATGTPKPDFAAGGMTMLVLTVFIGSYGLIHGLLLTGWFDTDDGAAGGAGS